MKRRVLLASGLVTTLAVFSLSASSMAQGDDPTRDDDERPRVAVMLDRSTGRFVFSDDFGALPFLPVTGIPTADPLGIHLIATTFYSKRILSAPNGFDLDHDSSREFILRVGDHFEVWESTGGIEVFQLVHTVDVPDVGIGLIAYNPGDVGDADHDGLADLAAFGRIGNDYPIRVYESTSTNNYPTEIVWELPNERAVGIKIEDTDNDDVNELVVAGLGSDFKGRVVIYENDGNDSYAQTFYEQIPEMHTAQFMEVADDLDGDGWDEILFGGLITDNSGSAKVYAFEATSDDTYQQTWSRELVHPDGQIVNAEFIRYAGDLDGDGKKEFLLGGLKTGPPWFTVLYVFEAQSDDDFEIVTTFSLPVDLDYWSGADVGDVDADGKKEIVFGSGTDLRIYQNTGDNSWEEVWGDDAATIRAVGAGDHDGNGAQEFIFQKFPTTSIFEGNIVDSDEDGLSNALDNCPLTSNRDQSDGDDDDVGDACDNCIYGFNPAQGQAIFGQEIQALDSETFSWPEPAEVVYASGDLALVSTYTVDLVQALPLGTSFMDPSVPASGEGFFYLVKPDCGVGSWQSDLGAEPGRDAALP